ncbi:hypothetical protein HMPREF3291_03355 [Bacillus sp. HMSC76G11]|nr:hypothetical protein HMPREF3291_03355 [Bacillus sp. HMSC76G11]
MDKSNRKKGRQNSSKDKIKLKDNYNIVYRLLIMLFFYTEVKIDFLLVKLIQVQVHYILCPTR